MTARKRLANAATVLAAITSPLAVVAFYAQGIALWLSVLLGLLCVGAFRGAVDQALKHLIERPKLDLDATPEDMTEDALARRRLYFWARKFRLLFIFAGFVSLCWLFRGGSWLGTLDWILGAFGALLQPQILMYVIIMPMFLVMNFVILFGPMMLMGVSQMKTLEPGDADFGVALGDVRGQAEAKEEIRKVVTLWQAGERFVASGGKRERGVLFLGPPGTGKTMLAKAIATGFNSPIVMMPGSGFAQTFIGMDVIIVRYMAWRARKLAGKWGGQCIVFIDEIDAVGMRRAALGGFPPSGAAQMPGGMMGGMGQMGLQSLLVVMDGIDNPPFMRKLAVNKLNLWLDALYVVPQAIGPAPLRLPRAKPTGNQIFFVGATNVPLEALDPALTRPGRMGRHIYFRTPTKRDRLDIFDLYLARVSHEPDLDTERAREELARVTSGYSPAQIEQVCSIALTYAHHSKREAFSRADLLEAMVTVEAGTALTWGYESEKEERSTAVHEAGHCVAAHLFMDDHESTRLSIRRRGATGGHHQVAQEIERTFQTREELFANLIWALGAYAAEMVFYGHSTQGTGGDLGSASYTVGNMVGRWGMGPMPMNGDEKEYARIGRTLLAAARPGDIRLDSTKVKTESILLGQAFMVAYHTISINKLAVEKIVGRLLREKEIYGDDLTALLDSCELQRPVITERLDPSDYPKL